MASFSGPTCLIFPSVYLRHRGILPAFFASGPLHMPRPLLGLLFLYVPSLPSQFLSKLSISLCTSPPQESSPWPLIKSVYTLFILSIYILHTLCIVVYSLCILYSYIHSLYTTYFIFSAPKVSTFLTSFYLCNVFVRGLAPSLKYKLHN